MGCSGYEYSEYLKRWEERFGECETGNYPYTHCGREMSATINKLTKKQFVSVRSRLAFLMSTYESEEGEKQERVLEEMFPYELALLM